LGRVEVQLEGARELVRSAARLLDVADDSDSIARGKAEHATVVAKIAATEAAASAATEAVQVFGGYGYMRHYPVERSMRDAKVMQLITGTNRALRQVVASRALVSASEANPRPAGV